MITGAHHTAQELNRWALPATRRSVAVGNLRVTYLPDGYVELHPRKWFSLDPEDTVLDDRPELIGDNGHLIGSIGSLLVTGPNVDCIIDAGFGPRTLPAHQSHPALGAMFGGRLADAEVPEFTAAFFTHLHEDHTGWLRALGSPLQQALAGVMKYASERELTSNGLVGATGWESTIPGVELLGAITARSSPGHTLGHSSFLISSKGEALLCFGDVMHSPLQIEHPHLNSCFEEAPSTSVESRMQVLEFAAETGIISAGMHFGDVVFGRVEATRGHYRWLPVT